MKSHYFRYVCVLAAWCLACLSAAPARAGVVIDNTRVIYPAQQREVTVKLINEDKQSPLLVQAWIDDGNEKSTPDQLNVPFLLTPPVFRMDPGKGQALRVVYLKDRPLPADRESVFWLNVLEVPPKPKVAKGEESNTLQLAFRTRIKLFYRPEDLKGSAADAPSQLRWTLVTDGAGRALQAENPSAYHVSFESVALAVEGRDIKSEDVNMIAPHATQRFSLKEVNLTADAKLEVHFTSIGDYGELVTHAARLTP
ncbi:fimbria/pilus periplasmic chaperone [Dyella subtropica]|uniref:fimbria/pilus periplasmic chaperone n=1 Tax=Dyella subtropica TaxID=2992127 RepID=UPI002B1CDE90|nr:fimbria/pilus periplasmic chaperone [Dyella subtropica]